MLFAGVCPTLAAIMSGVANLQSLRRIITVSYTHLRAHETRHDLVCRLLLEKKKHIYKPTRQEETAKNVVCFLQNEKNNKKKTN